MNDKPQDKLYAILSVDKNGNEGICMVNHVTLGPVLAVCGTDSNLQSLKEQALNGIDEAWAVGLKIVVGEFKRVGTQELT